MAETNPQEPYKCGIPSMNHALRTETHKAAEFDFEGDLDLAPIRPAIKLLGNYSAQSCNRPGSPASRPTD